MKICLPFTVCLLMLSTVSCKKAIEKKQRDVLIDAMTNGQWIVEKYMEGTNDITAEFTGHSFQFEENGAVHASNGSMTWHGSWSGDIDNRSIISQFPTADDPVKKLNGSWRMLDSDWTYVKAELVTATGKNILQLRKKQ